MVFGADVLAAIHEGFLNDGDYRAVVPLLGAPLVSLSARCTATFSRTPAPLCPAPAVELTEAALDAEAHAKLARCALVQAQQLNTSSVTTCTTPHATANRHFRAAAVAAFEDEACLATPETAGRDTAHAAKLLDHVFGVDVLAAILGSFLDSGDFRAVVPLLGAPATANAHVRAASQEAFEEACAAGAAGVAGLCVSLAGVDGDVHVEDGRVTGVWCSVRCSWTGASDTLLTAAARRGDAGVVRALAASGKVDVNRPTRFSGCSALAVASKAGHAACVAALLATEGIDANHANRPGNICRSSGNTALTMAAEAGRAEVVCALLAADGIDANHTTEDGLSALMIASQRGHTEVVRALLAVDGIDTNATDSQDCSALMLATHRGHEGSVRLLAAASGIDINLPCIHFGNNTALHCACEEMRGATRVEMAELLLTAGGCRFQINDDAKTPPDLAGGDAGVAAVFASGVDYWQRRRHGGHAWAMKEVVATLLVVDQRLDAKHTAILPYLPKEIWLVVCGFLRSADFMP